MSKIFTYTLVYVICIIYVKVYVQIPISVIICQNTKKKKNVTSSYYEMISFLLFLLFYYSSHNIYYKYRKNFYIDSIFTNITKFHKKK